MEQRRILFSPPDITEAEIESVVSALKSGWITTGPRTKELEKRLCAFTQADGYACFASATAALECCLRALGIGPGDEVIVPAYTYTASCSPVCHVGATPVMCDIAPDSFEMDYDQMAALVTPRTKAVVPVDLGGRMCDYEKLYSVLESKKDMWAPVNDLQKCFDRVIVVADGAHSLGAMYKGKPSGAVADFTSFSFHAVKNFTTAEGGGLAWLAQGFDSDEFYRQMMLQSLHGQTKDALSKNKAGAWEYDIAFPGNKCNMTDILASIGLVQLDRYPELLARRKDMIAHYEAGLSDANVSLICHFDENSQSSGHLMLVNLTGKNMAFRNALIEEMAERGVATNVHYKPLPLLTAYKDLGFNIDEYPNAYARFANEITLPLHTLLSDEDIDYIIEVFKQSYAACEARADLAER